MLFFCRRRNLKKRAVIFDLEFMEVYIIYCAFVDYLLPTVLQLRIKKKERKVADSKVKFTKRTTTLHRETRLRRRVDSFLYTLLG